MKCTVSLLVLWWHKHWGVFLLSCYTITPDMVVITVMASFHEMYPESPHVLWWHKHWSVFLLSCYTITQGMVVITVMASFHEMYPVSPPVLWWHKHWSVFLLSCCTITPGMVVITVMASFHEMYPECPCTLMTQTLECISVIMLYNNTRYGSHYCDGFLPWNVPWVSSCTLMA